MRTSVAISKPIPQTKTNIEGLEALETADLMVMFTRFRALPDDQLARITKYVDAGKPVVGLRTSTHAFLYPEGSPHVALNDGFGRDVFGQKWITHHGNKSSTSVTLTQPRPAASDPARRDAVSGALVAVSRPAAQRAGDDPARGHSINSQQTAKAEQYPPHQPVAWTREHKGARVFFTTLGHPADFSQESMRRLVVNGILWALGKDVPQGAPRDARHALRRARELRPVEVPLIHWRGASAPAGGASQTRSAGRTAPAAARMRR